MQKAEELVGWIEGLGPEKHWRVMVAVLTLLFTLGVLMGSLGVRIEPQGGARRGVVMEDGRGGSGLQP